MVVKRLFLHPTFDCSFDKVCREDCYLLAGKSDEEKKFRLPDEYWTQVVHSAGKAGFKELSLPINPKASCRRERPLILASHIGSCC